MLIVAETSGLPGGTGFAVVSRGRLSMSLDPSRRLYYFDQQKQMMTNPTKTKLSNLQSSSWLRNQLS